MKTLLGRFYFKLTDSKNLIGEYSNNQCNKTYTEGAIRIQPYEKDRFVGTYRSTWCEDNGNVCHLAELKIGNKTSQEDAYSLLWYFVDVKNGVVDPNPHFEGEGMLCDGVLIGDYWECGHIK
jgi:hypothetical protein